MKKQAIQSTVKCGEKTHWKIRTKILSGQWMNNASFYCIVVLTLKEKDRANKIKVQIYFSHVLSYTRVCLPVLLTSVQYWCWWIRKEPEKPTNVSEGYRKRFIITDFKGSFYFLDKLTDFLLFSHVLKYAVNSNSFSRACDKPLKQDCISLLSNLW